MLTFLSRLARRYNRVLTRGPALLRRLGIPHSTADPARRGFIIVQIDGLSYPRLLHAMRRRQLPFLRHLVTRKKYHLHRYLSEVPTSTPAFQGGMFYGNNDNIPGFLFYDKFEKRYYRMGQADSAYSVEQGVRNPGLLRGGSGFNCFYMIG